MAAYRSNGTSIVSLTSTVWNILFDIVPDPESGHVVIVIDALDECGLGQLEDSFGKLGVLLGISKRQENNVRNLFTGRSYNSAEKGFHSLKYAAACDVISSDDNPQAISEEINVMIRISVTDFSRRHDLDDFISARLETCLLPPTHRTYLWLCLVMDHLEAAVRNSVKLTAKWLEAATRTLSCTVEDAYEKLLKRSMNPKMTRRALNILLAARRSLTIGELHEATCTEVNTKSMADLDLESDARFRTYFRERCGLFVSICASKYISFTTQLWSSYCPRWKIRLE
jgi:hypothetical protein